MKLPAIIIVTGIILLVTFIFVVMTIYIGISLYSIVNNLNQDSLFFIICIIVAISGIYIHAKKKLN